MSWKNNYGFTLLELLVVLAILAMLSAIAVTRLGGVYQNSQFDTAISSLTTYDSHARRLAAKKNTPLELRIDLNGRQFSIEMNGEPAGQPIAIPSSVQVERFLSSRERKMSGTATVRLGSAGAGETYALKLASPGRSPQWLVMAGGSGQSTLVEKTRDVEEVFRVLKQQSAHTP